MLMLKKKLRKQSISWQTRVEKSCLTGLLVNKQAVGPLLKFLESTKIEDVQKELE